MQPKTRNFHEKLHNEIEREFVALKQAAKDRINQFFMILHRIPLRTLASSSIYNFAIFFTSTKYISHCKKIEIVSWKVYLPRHASPRCDSSPTWNGWCWDRLWCFPWESNGFPFLCWCNTRVNRKLHLCEGIQCEKMLFWLDLTCLHKFSAWNWIQNR